MEHTQGKWILSTNCRIRDEYDNNIASCGGNASHFDWRTSQANARLIAAAPDLLRACNAASQMLKYSLTETNIDELQDILQQAIEKATK